MLKIHLTGEELKKYFTEENLISNRLSHRIILLCTLCRIHAPQRVLEFCVQTRNELTYFKLTLLGIFWVSFKIHQPV